MATVTPTGSPVASLCCCGSSCPVLGYNGVLWIPGFGTLDINPADYPDLTEFPITRNWLTKKLSIVETLFNNTGRPTPPGYPAVIKYDGTITIDVLSGRVTIDESWNSEPGNPNTEGWAVVQDVMAAIYNGSANGINPFQGAVGYSLSMSDTSVVVSWSDSGPFGYSTVGTLTLDDEYTPDMIQANLDSLMQQLTWDQVKALMAKQTQKSTPNEDCCVIVCWDCAAFYGQNPAYPSGFFGTGVDQIASFYATLWPTAQDGATHKLIPPWNPMPAGDPILLVRAGINTNNPSNVNGTVNAAGASAPPIFDIQVAASIQFQAAFAGATFPGSAVGQKILVVTGGTFCVAHSQDTALAQGPGPYDWTQPLTGDARLPAAGVTLCTLYQGSSVTLPDNYEVVAPRLKFVGDNSWVNDYYAYYYGWSVNPSPTTLPNPFSPPCQQLCLPP